MPDTAPIPAGEPADVGYLLLPADEQERLSALRERIGAALQDSLDDCPRCSTCGLQTDAVMEVLQADAVVKALDAELPDSPHFADGCHEHHGLVRDFGGSRPPIVCLCGSTRFAGEFNRQRKLLTEAGEIVLSIEVVTTQAREDDPQHADPALKTRLDELHKRKIDLADRVLVLNVGGYVGNSTRSEIDYALAHGKPVSYLEAGHMPGSYQPPGPKRSRQEVE